MWGCRRYLTVFCLKFENSTKCVLCFLNEMSGWKPRYLYATVISNKKQIPQNLATPAYGLISFPEFIAGIFWGQTLLSAGIFRVSPFAAFSSTAERNVFSAVVPVSEKLREKMSDL